MAPHDASEPEYVGFWLRVGAALLDTILMMMLTAPLLWYLYGPAYWHNPSFDGGLADLLIGWVLPAIVIMLFWLARSTTPGKMAIDAVIVDARTGARPSARQFLVRYIGYFVSSIPLGLGLIWVGIDARKQGWHDKMAGTVVVKRRRRTTPPLKR
ncbi:RDD family protein [Massilia sp. CFBP9012]|uniref:RDD family protein n=1 Tax=Massilia sp. CFBP9012 TaxID=3096531 RepID=UPI002A6B148F|nr:RDD family protein [Massilia sp. CFBP9012]MDY0973839.1 RDD family protein [Massilia sp. CFBP9012]